MAKLFGMHTIELHPGVKPEDFERFVVEEVNPGPHLPGVVSHLLKGDRGASPSHLKLERALLARANPNSAQGSASV